MATHHHFCTRALRMAFVPSGIILMLIFGPSLIARSTAAPGGAPPSAPLLFIENVGQFDPGARFVVPGAPGGAVWLADGALWLTVLAPPDEDAAPDRAAPPGLHTPTSLPREGVNFRLSFVGANPHARLQPFNRLETHVSYFFGSDPAGWRPGVPVWGGVRYVDLYPGVDLELSGEGGLWGQRLLTRPGADLSAVRLRVEGANTIRIADDRLYLTTARAEISIPLFTVASGAWPGSMQPLVSGDAVIAPFARTGSQQHGAGSAPESNQLLYATYLGGTNIDMAFAVAVDGDGNTAVTGNTYSWDFPTTPGAFSTTYGAVFVSKLNASGTGLIYSTFIGGTVTDYGYAIASDSSGNAYIAGVTQGAYFPTTPGAYDTSYNGNYDAFVTSLNSTGTALRYSTFLGGSNSDTAQGIFVDSGGNAYVTGRTGSAGFPTTPGAFDTSFNGDYWGDAFVTRLNATGSGLLYSTFLGGSGTDSALAIAVDGSGNAYVTGSTASTDLPTTAGTYDATFGGGYADAFVSKLNPAGSALVYSTYLGGNADDHGLALAVGPGGTITVVGNTYGDFPITPGALDTTVTADESFVTRLNAAGTGLVYSTYLGGSAVDEAHAVVVDGSGYAYVSGFTASSDFPTSSNVIDGSFNGVEDAFVAKVNNDGTRLAYSTFLGGSQAERGQAIVLDADTNVHVAGYTRSRDFPITPGAYDTTWNTDWDIFIAVMTMSGESPTPTPTITPTPIPGNVTIMTENFEGAFPGPGWEVDGHWGKSVCQKHTGSYSAWAEGSGGLGCGSYYHLNELSWLVYGPFSLANADDANLDFWMWLNAEYGYDGLFAGASLDGEYFYGNVWTGTSTEPGLLPALATPARASRAAGLLTPGGERPPRPARRPDAVRATWTPINFDLTNVYYLGNLTGQPQVWIAFLWISDPEIALAEGAFVDDVALTSYSSHACYTVNYTAFPSGGGAVYTNRTPNCNDYTGYTLGTVMELEAYPAPGYAFSHWSGDASGAANPVSHTVQWPAAIVGNFITDPPTTFLDVSTAYWAYAYIESLYASGITAGCAADPFPLYCPENSVTRAQMAIFLLRGIHGASYQPPPATGTMFTDVPAGYWAAAWIEQLAAEGITGGCGPGLYCPETAVTRAQMAIFLLRSEHGASYQPPAASGTMFTDVPASYWAAAWIEQLAAEGITGGCGPGLYCPEASVTRAQMAVFLVRTFNLPLP